MACQVKLLRVLQEQRFEPLGSSKTRQVDVRIVCATNADLPAMVAARTFREDLFYRINLVNVELPPLRMRKDDVPLLAEKFLTDAAHANSLDVPALGPDAVTFLKSLPYPGNIRELKNLVERTLLICGGATLTEADFRRSGANVAAGDVAPAAGTLDEVERERIVASMERHGGNVSRVAAELGLSRGALYRRLEKFNLKS